MSSIVLTGAAGDLGRRVLDLLKADPTVERILAVDREGVQAIASPGPVEAIQADLGTVDLVELFDGTDVIIHLASNAEEPGGAQTLGDVHVARRVLDAAGLVGAKHVVMRSSATVYGARSDNPVPLTEEAPLRPEPRLAWATERAEIERLVVEFRRRFPGTTTTVLRPAVTVSERTTSWLATALRATALIGAGDVDPPLQFLHLDDLATAIDLVRKAEIDGAVNVAPDGWIPGETVRALAGTGPRIRLPEPLATRFAAWRWRRRLAPTPPGLVPYTVHPWVISNDKLLAAGWKPEFSNEEAYVEGHDASPWADLSPRRRQELALGVAGVVVAAGVAGVVALLRRRARDRA